MGHRNDDRNRKRPKLAIRRETLRRIALTDEELGQVAGGGGDNGTTKGGTTRRGDDYVRGGDYC